jgi:hypothetical protein
MAYIDYEYFETYTTTAIDESEFTVLAERASDVIDMLTMQKIPAYGFSSYSEATQAAIKKATAAEVDTLYAQGSLSALVGNADTGASSFSIGKFSMSNSSSSGTTTSLKTVNGIPVSPLINGYLLMTGLLYCGLGC